mmetsp:Transcript_19961/g.45318  ORF Transcript_19961/g.45318 Transcript_19961/m.45318 type:complete len:307 (-) Transcript_19961:1315-2235(-)
MTNSNTPTRPCSNSPATPLPKPRPCSLTAKAAAAIPRTSSPPWSNAATPTASNASWLTYGASPAAPPSAKTPKKPSSASKKKRPPPPPPSPRASAASPPSSAPRSSDRRRSGGRSRRCTRSTRTPGRTTPGATCRPSAAESIRGIPTPNSAAATGTRCCRRGTTGRRRRRTSAAFSRRGTGPRACPPAWWAGRRWRSCGRWRRRATDVSRRAPRPRLRCGPRARRGRTRSIPSFAGGTTRGGRAPPRCRPRGWGGCGRCGPCGRSAASSWRSTSRPGPIRGCGRRGRRCCWRIFWGMRGRGVCICI